MLVGLLVMVNEIDSGNSVVIGYLGSNTLNKTDIASVLMAIDDARASGVLPNSTQIE
jgi:hypothetical protein